MALWYGGLAQLLAGMWEFATGNTFGATGESFSHYHIQVMAVAANLPGLGRVLHVSYDVGEVRLLASLLRSVWHKTHSTPCRHGYAETFRPAVARPYLYCLGVSADLFPPPA